MPKTREPRITDQEIIKISAVLKKKKKKFCCAGNGRRPRTLLPLLLEKWQMSAGRAWLQWLQSHILIQTNLLLQTYPESPRMITFSNTFFLEVILQTKRRKEKVLVSVTEIPRQTLSPQASTQPQEH